MKALIQSCDVVSQWWLTGMERACWQGGFALAVVWIISRLWPRLPARAKSWLWRLAYLKLLVALLCPTTIDLSLLPSRKPAAAGVDFRVGTIPAPVQIEAGAEPLAPPRQPEPPKGGTPYGDTSAYRESRLQPARLTLPKLATGLAFLWALGAAWRALELFKDWRSAKQLRRASRPVGEEWLARHCQELCGCLRLGRVPKVLESEMVSSPSLLGVRHPAIILPGALCRNSTQGNLKLMLAHELGHLKRRDLLWMWLPLAVEVLFFFHPLIWVAGREWRLIQEVACDEIAVRLANVPARDYGEMLLVVARNLVAPARANFNVVGVIETKQTLERRLVAMKSNRQKPGWSILMSAASLLVIGGLGVLPWRAVAQEAEQNQPSQKPKSSQPPGPRREAPVAAPREVLDAQRNLAVTELQIAESELARNKDLVNRGVAPVELLDASKLKLAQARVHLAEAESSIKENRPASQADAIGEPATGGGVIRISSPRPGVVEKIFVKPGAKVKKGDRLLALNSDSEKARVSVARALLEVAQAQFRPAELEAKNATRAAETGTMSSGEIEVAQARRAIAQAQLNLAKSQLVQAEVELDQFTLRAPRDGTVLRVSIREGEYARVPSESPLMVIADGSDSNKDTAMIRDTRVFPLKYASSGEVVERIRQMVSKEATVLVDERINALVVLAEPNDLQRATDAVTKLDVASGTGGFH